MSTEFTIEREQMYISFIMQLLQQLMSFNLQFVGMGVEKSQTERKEEQERFDRIMQIMMLKMVNGRMDHEHADPPSDAAKMKCKKCGSDEFEPSVD